MCPNDLTGCRIDDIRRVMWIYKIRSHKWPCGHLFLVSDVSIYCFA